MWRQKYRKRVLTGQVATRVRDFCGQIAAENKLENIYGRVAAIALTAPVERDKVSIVQFGDVYVTPEGGEIG